MIGRMYSSSSCRCSSSAARCSVSALTSGAAVAADCAKSYLSAFGTLFEGDDVKAQAGKVSDQFKTISADCKAALSGG